MSIGVALDSVRVVFESFISTVINIYFTKSKLVIIVEMIANNERLELKNNTPNLSKTYKK